ncbi:transcriptional regulator, TetR family [Spongiibacter sp. IMCC21906]|uniref:TetR/AcrR family transcriptional regulator n=1 Tax=Spongiibacter sp. IMCC21906 TaxID=1620392 RepID=UPI00062DEB74|nr:TetR/AcrR family transcriptional regulator [Spongiibacter sp. IMCC21906]AKH68280.1 transcriptional regulator, TetR family [Spongiibacter sp. IMCC21906]
MNKRSGKKMTAAKKRWGNGARVDDLETGKKILLRSAVECFVTRGIKATTIEDIAQEANVTRRTVYRYFNGKTDIIAALIQVERSRMFHKLEEHLQGMDVDFSTLLNESIWYAATYLPPEEGKADLVSGINASEASPFLYSDESSEHWHKILAEPLKQYNREHNKTLDLEDLIAIVARLVLSFRQHPASRAEFNSMLQTFRL